MRTAQLLTLILNKITGCRKEPCVKYFAMTNVRSESACPQMKETYKAMMQIEGSIVSCRKLRFPIFDVASYFMSQIEKFKKSTRPIDNDWSDEDEEECQIDKYDLPDPMLALRRGQQKAAFNCSFKC